MKILCHLVHPAHYHLFRPVVNCLSEKGWEVLYTIRNKDVLEALLSNDDVSYQKIGDVHKGSKIIAITKRFKLLLNIARQFKPDIIISSATEAALVGRFLRIPNLIFFEDDLKEVKLWAYTTAPIAKVLLCPTSCSALHWEKKVIKYNGYHELAYLHPNNFRPNSHKPEQSHKKILIRLAKLTAYHDKKNPGITDDLLSKIIKIVEKYGEVFLSTERELGNKFQQYKE